MLANFSAVEFEKTILKFRKRKRKLLSYVHVIDKTSNYALSHCSRVAMAKKSVNLLFFRCSLLLPSLKLPNNLILGNLNGALIFSEFLAIKMAPIQGFQ